MLSSIAPRTHPAPSALVCHDPTKHTAVVNLPSQAVNLLILPKMIAHNTHCQLLFLRSASWYTQPTSTHLCPPGTVSPQPVGRLFQHIRFVIPSVQALAQRRDTTQAQPTSTAHAPLTAHKLYALAHCQSLSSFLLTHNSPFCRLVRLHQPHNAIAR